MKLPKKITEKDRDQRYRQEDKTKMRVLQTEVEHETTHKTQTE